MKPAQSATICEVHDKSFELYWEDCSKWIWTSCIVDHPSHKICSVEDKCDKEKINCIDIIKKTHKKEEELSKCAAGLKSVKLIREVFAEGVAQPSINKVVEELNLFTKIYTQDAQCCIDQVGSLKDKLKKSNSILEANDDKNDTDGFHATIKKIESAKTYLDKEVVVNPSLKPLLHVETDQFTQLCKVIEFINDKSENEERIFWNTVNTLRMKLFRVGEKIHAIITNAENSNIEYHILKITHPECTQDIPKILLLSKDKNLELDISHLWRITKYETKRTVEFNIDILQVKGDLTKHLAQLKTGIINLHKKAIDKIEHDFEELIPDLDKDHDRYVFLESDEELIHN